LGTRRILKSSKETAFKIKGERENGYEDSYKEWLKITDQLYQEITNRCDQLIKNGVLAADDELFVLNNVKNYLEGLRTTGYIKQTLLGLGLITQKDWVRYTQRLNEELR